MKKLIFASFAVSAILITVLFSCKRELSFEKQDPIKQARYLFNQKNDRLLTVVNGKLVGGNNYPDWRHAIIYPAVGKGFDIIEMPLLENIRHIAYYKSDNLSGSIPLHSSLRKLLIFKRENQIKDVVLTIIPKKSYLAKNVDLSKINTEYIPPYFEGLLIFETFDGHFIKGAEYKDGKLKSMGNVKKVNSNIGITPSVSINPTPTQIYLGWACMYCEMNISNGDQPNSQGIPCSSIAQECNDLYYDYDQNGCANSIYGAVCGCNGNAIDYSGCGWYGSGGGGNGSGTPYPEYYADHSWMVTNIQDSTNNPCVQSTLQTLKGLDTTVSKLIRDFFDSTTLGFHVVLKIANNGAGEGANTITQTISDTFTITINSYFQNATDLSVAATIIHEHFHAQLLYWFRHAVLLNDTTLQQKLALDYGYQFAKEISSFDSSLTYIVNNGQASHHNDMAIRYRDMVGQAIYNFAQRKGITASLDYCRDLAYTGTFDSRTFKNLSQARREEIILKINAERDPYGATVNPGNEPHKGNPCL